MPDLTLPSPRPWPEARPLRWGILAPGGIAERFAQALQRRTSQRVVAVGSRSADRAEAFAQAHGIPRSYGDYRALVEDPEVDAVYVASPHSAHVELALLAISAGKHVLVEKPLATTGDDARRILDAARAAGVFAMEAMWTRYLAQSDIVRQVLADGALGEVTSVAADFGFSIPYLPEHRLFDPSQAGGALLDAGVYPVSFISSVLGAPGELSAIGSLAASGVDDQAIVSFSYPGAVATATTSLKAWLPVTAVVAGTAGRLEVGPGFLGPTTVRLSRFDQGWEPEVAEWTDAAFAGPGQEGLACQAEAFAGFVEQGLVESPIHRHDEVVAIVDALDRAQQQIFAAAREAVR
ncbi:Gfo/Idh/MocA family protein [Microbacterium sp. SS28]|uniref:Gfo/Idh/MocA family protein n=1 Tax=Microbacterium sp. SS28 TaxID=2919948 RepID=UPI001FAA80D9|nr:Gfo/Idh/MocA family oxidoreductase [Microbacterium sp. SS28]